MNRDYAKTLSGLQTLHPLPPNKQGVWSSNDRRIMARADEHLRQYVEDEIREGMLRALVDGREML